MAGAANGWTIDRARLTAGSAVLIVITFLMVTVVRNLVGAAHRTIGWVVASGLVALLLSPAVDWLARYMKRGLAIALAMLATLLLISSVLAGVLTDLQVQIEGLKEDLPRAAAEIEADEGGTAEAARDFELQARVESFVDALDERVSQRAAAEGALDTAPAYFLNGILVVFFLVFGRRTAHAFLRQFSDPEARERWAGVARDAIRDGQRYSWGAVGQAAAAGLLAGVTAWLLDLPAPAVIGVVMAAMSLVPYVGVLLGSVPLLLLAAGFQPGWVTGLVAVGVVVAQALCAMATHYVAERSVHVGPAVVVIVALVGFGAYGFGGAFYATALSVFAVAVLDAATPEPDDEAKAGGDIGAGGGPDADDEPDPGDVATAEPVGG